MEIADVVARLLPGARVLSSVLMTGGASALVHRVEIETGDGEREAVVVRRQREVVGKTDPPGRAAREFAALSALHEHGVAVPRPRLFLPPVTLVMDYVEGSTTLPTAPELAMGAALAAIHSLPPQTFANFADLPMVDDPLPGLREWLPALPAALLGCGAYIGPACVLHGDFWAGNLLWRGEALAAVLDWEDVARGDPLADLAGARVELARLRGDASAEQFTHFYAERCTVDAARLLWWDLFVATAQLTFMDGWGLSAEDLTSRRVCAKRWQARTLAVLGIPALG